MIYDEVSGSIDCLTQKEINHTLHLYPDKSRDITLYDRDKLKETLETLLQFKVQFNAIIDKEEFYIILF